MPAIPETEVARHTACTDSSLRTLSIDIGGTLIKTAIIDEGGALVSEFVTMPTPKLATPEAVIALIKLLTYSALENELEDAAAAPLCNWSI